MDDRQIDRILSSNALTRRFFVGVYPSDRIPMPTRYPASMIVNLDEAGKPGSHWIALWIKSPSEIVHFDSYGSAPEGRILEFLDKFEKKTTLSPFLIQSIISDVCAHYCIYFVFQSSKGRSYESILSSLASKTNPDIFVRNFTAALSE